MASKTSIRSTVEDLLKKYNVTGAPINIEEIAKSEGATIEYHLLKSGVSGFSFSADDEQKIGVNVQESAVRQRFTMAHELGHLKLGAKGLNYDQSPGLQFRNEDSTTGSQKKEVDANFFAAELLMPEEMLKADLEEAKKDTADAEIIAEKLAGKYDVSTQAMNVRLTSLGLFSIA